MVLKTETSLLLIITLLNFTILIEAETTSNYELARLTFPSYARTYNERRQFLESYYTRMSYSSRNTILEKTILFQTFIFLQDPFAKEATAAALRRRPALTGRVTVTVMTSVCHSQLVRATTAGD